MKRGASSHDTPRRRVTHRKRILREVLDSKFPGQAVPLDELRWEVFRLQLETRSAIQAEIVRSFINSFARTVREQLPDHRIEKVPIRRQTPVGLIARFALFRLKDGDALCRFLSAENGCILCRYKTNHEVDEPRYRSRYVTPHHHVATFRFFENRPSSVSYDQIAAVPGTLIPATQQLSLIVPRGARVDLKSLADIPWILFAYDDLSEWHEVANTDPLESVHRDRYG